MFAKKSSTHPTRKHIQRDVKGESTHRISVGRRLFQNARRYADRAVSHTSRRNYLPATDRAMGEAENPVGTRHWERAVTDESMSDKDKYLSSSTPEAYAKHQQDMAALNSLRKGRGRRTRRHRKNRSTRRR